MDSVPRGVLVKGGVSLVPPGDRAVLVPGELIESLGVLSSDAIAMALFASPSSWSGSG